MSETATNKLVRRPGLLRTSDGTALAVCYHNSGGGRDIYLYATSISAVDVVRLSQWLLRAAAWVKDGKR